MNLPVDIKRDWKKYSIFLLYSSFFIIFASFGSLNRLNGNPIDFPGRIYVEHIIAGIGMPLAVAIITISFALIILKFIKKDFTKKHEIILLLSLTILWTIFETLYQFAHYYNSDSWLQMISFSLGIICLWVSYYFILLKKKKNFIPKSQ